MYVDGYVAMNYSGQWMLVLEEDSLGLLYVIYISLDAGWKRSTVYRAVQP